MNDFNLIVTTYRYREEEAEDEILEVLERFGDDEAVSELTEIRGIILVRTTINPLDVVARIKDLVSSEPWLVRYILRVLPVQSVVPADLESIGQTAKFLGKVIGAGDTFRITVEKRHTLLRSQEVISAIAQDFPNKVDLENPTWVILVQIIGSRAGISVIKPDQVFSSIIEKRK